MAGGNGRLLIDKVVGRKIQSFSIIQQPMIVISLKFVDLGCVAFGSSTPICRVPGTRCIILAHEATQNANH